MSLKNFIQVAVHFPYYEQRELGQKVLQRLLEKGNQSEFHDIVNVLSARIPLLKFVDVNSGLECDLTFFNRLASMNSFFIKKCLEVDPR